MIDLSFISLVEKVAQIPGPVKEHSKAKPSQSPAFSTLNQKLV